MIPPLIRSDAPPGERLVYQRLASDPATDSWIVLHSQDLAEHVRQVQGEADFVVIVPGRGVAVIEVKSHTRVSRRDDGQWLLGSMPPTARGPFQQASEAMHSIRSYLAGKRIDLRGTPVVHGVWFTHVRARAELPASPEWHPWQLLDRDDLSRGAAPAVLRLIDQGAAHLASHAWGFSASSRGPDPHAAAAITAALRPRFELGSSSADIRRDRAAQLSRFLDEQYEALDAMEANGRVMFTGPAGSGKTFLALEACRRAAAAGGSGWLVCFNRALGAHLRERGAGAPGVEAGSLHAVMLGIAELQPPAGAGADFWQHELVDAALERLLEQDLARDYLIVDEVQDLAQPAYLDVLDLMVKGGLAGGRCLLFGDFERQAIYGLADGRPDIQERVPGLVTYGLTANCRNLPRIGAAAEMLSGMSPGYKRFRREDDGAQPRYYWYADPEEQSSHLAAAVRDLRDEGFELEEIAVLSMKRAGAAAQRCTDPWLRPLLIETDTAAPARGRVRYGTIHAFKGLEAPAVILTDVDDLSTPAFEALLYTGLTRPTDRLSVLATKQALTAKVLGRR